MRAMRIPEFADPPAPEPVDSETLVELVAAEIAPLDRQIAMGNLPGAGTSPIQPGGTGVGRFVSSGSLDPGELVYVGGGPFGLGNSWPGMAAEQVSVPGGTVLVLGATGSVGRAACQIAAAFGATVLAGARDISALDDLDAIPISLENLTGEVMAAG